jgi:hypothetical protein
MFVGTFFMKQVKRSREAQKHVVACVAAGTCLVPGCTDKIHTSGRCQAHYQSYQAYKRTMTDEEFLQFTLKLQGDGTLLRPQEIRELKRNDSDAVAAREIA